MSVPIVISTLLEGDACLDWVRRRNNDPAPTTDTSSGSGRLTASLPQQQDDTSCSSQKQSHSAAITLQLLNDVAVCNALVWSKRIVRGEPQRRVTTTTATGPDANAILLDMCLIGKESGSVIPPRRIRESRLYYHPASSQRTDGFLALHHQQAPGSIDCGVQLTVDPTPPPPTPHAAESPSHMSTASSPSVPSSPLLDGCINPTSTSGDGFRFFLFPPPPGGASTTDCSSSSSVLQCSATTTTRTVPWMMRGTLNPSLSSLWWKGNWWFDAPPLGTEGDRSWWRLIQNPFMCAEARMHRGCSLVAPVVMWNSLRDRNTSQDGTEAISNTERQLRPLWWRDHGIAASLTLRSDPRWSLSIGMDHRNPILQSDKKKKNTTASPSSVLAPLSEQNNNNRVRVAASFDSGPCRSLVAVHRSNVSVEHQSGIQDPRTEEEENSSRHHRIVVRGEHLSEAPLWWGALLRFRAALRAHSWTDSIGWSSIHIPTTWVRCSQWVKQGQHPDSGATVAALQSVLGCSLEMVIPFRRVDVTFFGNAMAVDPMLYLFSSKVAPASSSPTPILWSCGVSWAPRQSVGRLQPNVWNEWLPQRMECSAAWRHGTATLLSSASTEGAATEPAGWIGFVPAKCSVVWDLNDD